MGSAEGFSRASYYRNLSAIVGAGNPDETFFDAEDIEESVVAPAVGESVYFQRGPMVEGNLTLSSGSTVYTLGAHYIEAVSPEGKGGFENLSIPAGTELTAVYFVDSSAPAGTDLSGGGDLSYRHVQSAAASEWTVNHGLGKRPAVSVVDTSGAEVIGEVLYETDNRVVLGFSVPFSGEAYLN